MLFPTIAFAIFFAVVLPANWLLMSRPRAWKPFMLAASYVFYGAWDHRFVLLLAGSTAANQLFARLIHRTAEPPRRRGLLALAVAANIGALGWFKYAGFLSSSTTGILRSFGFNVSPGLIEVLLPIGISFFTFQALSYVVDVYRERLEPASNLDFAVYLSFFPHLVAGPIVRGSEFLPQLLKPRDPARLDSSHAFHLILRGLFKKTVVATYLSGAIVDDVFSSPAAHSSLEILVAIYAYAVQIYADFSGYTDMAIGIALLLGFRFPINFDRPYAAVSLQDFWRRWHITLSSWLRDYVYIPLGGSRGKAGSAGAAAGGGSRTARNLMITMLLGGLWHGAAWTFVAWGGLHGAGLAVERKLLKEGRARSVILSRIVTFHVVCLAWVFFRSESFASAAELLTRLVTAWGPAPALNPILLTVIAAAIAVQWMPTGIGERIQVAFSRLQWWRQAATLAVALVAVDVLAPEGIAPFIYFQF